MFQNSKHIAGRVRLFYRFAVENVILKNQKCLCEIYLLSDFKPTGRGFLKIGESGSFSTEDMSNKVFSEKNIKSNLW